MTERFVEVYAGAYASGKSETAINRARQFADAGEKMIFQHSQGASPNADTVAC